MSSNGTSSRNKHLKSPLDDKNLDITRDEFERIRSALENEEFRKLFFDYVEEIQDPENRKIYEQEITQFEKERGVEVTFIHPQPGFVIKTSIDGELKCFINIASCEHIAQPRHENALNPETGKRGLSWAIPLAQTPPRDDIDAKKQRCKVFDVVFHPNALHLAKRNGDFHKCLIETALDGVEREFHVKLDRTNLKYPKMEYKGMARPTVIRKLASDATPEEQEPHPLDDVCPARPTADSGKPKQLPLKTKITTTPEFTTPKYVIKHCRDVDLSEYTYELDAKMNTTVPRSLLVEIELPLLNSAADCQLDVTVKSIYLLSERAGAKYRLKLDLPFEVNDKMGNARFDTDKRRLCITLPVLRSDSIQERELHDVLRNFNREDSGVELHSNSESPVEDEDEEVGDGEAETELSDSIENQTKEANSDDSTLTTPTATTPVHSPRKFLKNSIHYQFPAKFDCNVLDNVITFVLYVRNVQPDSIAVLKQTNSVHVQLSTIGSGYYPTHYAFYAELPTNSDLIIEKADAEAWENNVLLNLQLNKTCEHLVHYLVGLDATDLNEYKIHKQNQVNNELTTKKLNLQHKELARTVKEEQICSSTEDDDDDDGTTTSNKSQKAEKKHSKKQRKRNKKRRSYSESACDALKAIEQTVQKPQNNDKANIEEDSSPERNIEESNNPQFAIPGKNRKQRSLSECHEHASVINSSTGSSCSKGILKHFSRYGPRPSISDSCSSFDEYHQASYSRSVDAGVNSFAHFFGGIPEEHAGGGGGGDADAGLSESCKKTVRFNDHIMKQVFRLDSSILGQRKKNQKRRDKKRLALQRSVSEGDSADYEDNKPAGSAQYLKSNNNSNDNTKKYAHHDSGLDLSNNENAKQYNNKPIKTTKRDLSLENEQNSLMFEMDDDI